MTIEAVGLWERIATETKGYWPGRNELPEILLEAFSSGRFEDDLDQLAVAIEDAWTSSEWPSRTLDMDVWAEMFDTVGFMHNAKRAPKPRHVPTVYRSEARLTAHGESYGWAEGMSWTSNLETARHFHTRNIEVFRFETRLLKIARPDSWSVLAHDDGRKEDEWVLDGFAAYEQIEVIG